MKKFFLILLMLVFALPAYAEGRETTYDRVMKSGVIRCGYFTRYPIIYKNLQTGKPEGVFYEYTEALGKALGLRIEWSEELGVGDIAEAIRSRRVDAVCSAIMPHASLARHVDFIRPVFYEPLVLYAHEGDTRFDYNPSGINSPDIRLVVVEGTVPSRVVDVDFPKARKIELPQLTPLSDLWVSVATGKADVVIGETSIGKEFMANNPGKIRIIPLDHPIRFSGPGIVVEKDDYPLVRMLNLATEELLYSGRIEPILKKYEKYKGAFLRVPLPYETAPMDDVKTGQP